MSSNSNIESPISSGPKRRRIQTDDDDENDEEYVDPSDVPFAPAAPSLRRLNRSGADDVDDAADGDTGIDMLADTPDNNSDASYDPGEEEEEGENLLENAMRDYQRIDALDTYGTEGIDDAEYGAMGTEERLAAEEDILRREERALGGGKGRHDAGAYYGAALGEVEEEEDEEARALRRRQFGRERMEAEEEEATATEEMEEEEVNLEAFDVPLREWIAQDRTRREIQRRFRKFLSSFVEDSAHNSGRRTNSQNALYESKIKSMAANNQSTLEVSYLHLSEAQPTLALWLADAPRDMLDVLNEVVTRHTLRLFPSYSAIQTDIFCRFAQYPILDKLRDLRRSHLDTLVKITGVVTRRSSVFPQVQLAYYDCTRCNFTLGPYRMEHSNAGSGDGPGGANAPGNCPNCQSTGPFKLNPSRTQYRNYQRVTLQETPGSIPPGRVPRSKILILTHDLIDKARPGEEVEVTGVYGFHHNYAMSGKVGFQVFDTQMEANHVLKREDLASSINLSERDKAAILNLAKDARIGERIVRSIAPSIYGHKQVKMAMAMSLFGGVPKNIGDKHRIRGDINVLLLGDPGTAKSQVLKYAEKTAPRAVYSTGKGASAVGLTAAVHKDPITREWTLEGGALVLADRGLCLIDEFDKMNEQDRTSIHEAMEQQSISISKAGIVTSLQARCSVIAAANPIGGRYDSSSTLSENVELTDPILQRFDILCVLQDTVDPVADERLANFVVGSHMSAIPTADMPKTEQEGGMEVSLSSPSKQTKDEQDLIPQDLLRKYIQYARTNIRPQLRGSLDQEKIASLYVALRKESASSGGVPIAVRHIESIMRMAEAHAKMHLREHVRDDDLDAAIQMMLTSFVSAQKFSVQRALQKSFAKYLNTGMEKAHLLLHILQELFRMESLYQNVRQRHKSKNVEDGTIVLEISLEDFQGKARERKVYDVLDFCHGMEFIEAGYELDERRGIIRRT